MLAAAARRNTSPHQIRSQISDNDLFTISIPRHTSGEQLYEQLQMTVEVDAGDEERIAEPTPVSTAWYGGRRHCVLGEVRSFTCGSY